MKIQETDMQTDKDHCDTPERVGLLVLHNASLVSLGCLAEAFLAANKYAGKDSYNVTIIVPEPNISIGQTALKVGATGLPRYHTKFDLILVCGGFGDASPLGLDSLAWLRRQRTLGAVIGGAGDAVIGLAKHGLIDPESAAYHWDILRSFEETLYVRGMEPKLYQDSGKEISCMGGITALDLALSLIAKVSPTCSSMGAFAGRWKMPTDLSDIV